MPVTQFESRSGRSSTGPRQVRPARKTLTVPRSRWISVKARGISSILGTIPLDDEETYVKLSRGETVGIFQVESQGMRSAPPRHATDHEDITAWWRSIARARWRTFDLQCLQARRRG